VLSPGTSEAVCIAVELPLAAPDTVQRKATRQSFTLVAEGDNAAEAARAADAPRPTDPGRPLEATGAAGTAQTAVPAGAGAVPTVTSAATGSTR
jgi:hypothetical protein